jgi:hypothetical protein
MSDTIPTTTPTTDAALDALRERQRELEIDARLIEARQEEVAELIAALTGRKQRAARKPRVVAPVEATEEAA